MYSKTQKFITTGVISLIAATSLFAGEVTIPNTFTANTPAKASEVNANFTAVKTAVDGNAYNIKENAKLLGGIATAELVESAELTGTYADQTSITVTVPADGYIYILATGSIQVFGKTNAENVVVTVGVTSASNSTPISTRRTKFYRNASDGTGNYVVPYSAQGLFQVTAGTHTFYLVGGGSGADSEKLFWNRLTATFHGHSIEN